MESKVLYLGDLEGGKVQAEDRYLVKILLAAGKKTITRSWAQVETPTYEQWLSLMEDIYVMEKMTHRLRLQNELLENRWCKWMMYKDSEMGERG